MLWLGNIIGSVLVSLVTCGILYFGFKAEENKIAAMQKNNDGNKV
ncbi:hypothetical protein [Bacillus wiedmannii]|nr:hypothetical protein [Bacillus wiedmannii]MED2839640.1 hypothetical protein [Bacillus wiedmannii]